MRIAVVGPDGAGKTSVVRLVHAQIPGSRVIYGGKNRGHLLRTTTVGLRMWHAARASHVPALAALVRFAVFYPLEYLENAARAARGRTGVAIYDRHPVDRMIMAGERRQRIADANPSAVRRVVRLALSDYPLLLLLKACYLRLYPRFDLLCFLLPDADLLVERARGQYSCRRRAEIKRQAYAAAARDLAHRQRVRQIAVSREMSVDAVAAQVLDAVGVPRGPEHRCVR